MSDPKAPIPYPQPSGPDDPYFIQSQPHTLHPGLTIRCPVCSAWINTRCFGPTKGEVREESHPDRIAAESDLNWVPTPAMTAMQIRRCPDCGAVPGNRCWSGRGVHQDEIHPARIGTP